MNFVCLIYQKKKSNISFYAAIVSLNGTSQHLPHENILTIFALINIYYLYNSILCILKRTTMTYHQLTKFALNTSYCSNKLTYSHRLNFEVYPIQAFVRRSLLGDHICMLADHICMLADRG